MATNTTSRSWPRRRRRHRHSTPAYKRAGNSGYSDAGRRDVIFMAAIGYTEARKDGGIREARWASPDPVGRVPSSLPRSLSWLRTHFGKTADPSGMKLTASADEPPGAD